MFYSIFTIRFNLVRKFNIVEILGLKITISKLTYNFKKYFLNFLIFKKYLRYHQTDFLIKYKKPT